MPILTELVISVVGGVLTALILAMFTRGARGADRGGNVAINHQVAPPPQRRSSAFGDTVRLILAVIGGVAFAMVVGRILIQAGIVPKGLPSRLVLLVVGTVLFWLVLSAGRRN